MKRVWTLISIISLLGFVVGCQTSADQAIVNDRTLSVQSELMLKSELISQDMIRTDQLSRQQTRVALQNAANALNSITQQSDASDAMVEEQLQQLQRTHPHIQMSFWSDNGKPYDSGIAVGQVKQAFVKEFETALLAAKQAADQGNEYESERIIIKQDYYFVQALPMQNSSLISIIRQDVVKQVESHQLKNLRAVPYPNENTWKIESVHSGTLDDKQVNTPEDNQGTSHYHTHEIVVKFKHTPDSQQLEKMQHDVHAEQVKQIGQTFVFRSKSMHMNDLRRYFSDKDIIFAEPHFLYLTNTGPRDQIKDVIPPNNATVPNDRLYSKYQWNLPIIDTELGWNIGKGDYDVIVAVIDTGVDLRHDDLAERLTSGYNAVNQGQEPADDVGHGTHVAGIISALVNNNEGVAGMSWFNPVMPIKVLDHTGAGSTYAVAEGIIWAADHGAKVINLSLGNYADASFLHEAIQYAFNKDVLLIAASGNDNTEQPGFPAAYPEVFAVAATDANKQKASFSNYGNYIDVAAPGVSIASTYLNNEYASLSGTSMATPHVSALAALIRSANPKLKNTEVMDIIRDTAIDIGPRGKDRYFGYGQIDVNRAMQMATKNTTTQTVKETTKLTWWERIFGKMK